MDAITQVVGAPFEFGGYPAGTSSKNLIASIGAPYFLTTFGFPRRDIMERRGESPSLAQALHLMNGDPVRGLVEKESNVLGELLPLESEDRSVVEELYLRAYSRPPTEQQWKTIRGFLDSERTAGRSRRRAFENLLLVLINSKEFQLNR
jgi:hypothetical protein